MPPATKQKHASTKSLRVHEVFRDDSDDVNDASSLCAAIRCANNVYSIYCIGTTGGFLRFGGGSGDRH